MISHISHIMAFSYILSISLIFCAVMLHHKAFTPPNSLPSTTTRIYAGVIEKTLFRSLTFVTWVQKVLFFKSSDNGGGEKSELTHRI